MLSIQKPAFPLAIESVLPKTEMSDSFQGNRVEHAGQFALPKEHYRYGRSSYGL